MWAQAQGPVTRKPWVLTGARPRTHPARLQGTGDACLATGPGAKLLLDCRPLMRWLWRCLAPAE
eukprot:13251612-Alexandrium_andersonii.AAC.1